jgi:hypothetical protein
MTITSNANRAGVIGLFSNNNGISGITASIGGVSGSAITGTDISSAGWRTLLFGVTAPPSGSQTVTASWTTAMDGSLGSTATSGVDQTTPFNNGNTASGGATSTSIAITSTNGDLTVDLEADNGTSAATPNQTQAWVQFDSGRVNGSSTGPGTGNTTHTWTTTGNSIWLASGCNFNQAASVAEPIGTSNIMSSPGRFIGWTA